MSELITVALTEGVADVRLNRPDKHNALTLEMFAAIVDAGAALAANTTVRAVVLSGNGPSFCAGLDLSIMRAMLAGPAEAQAVMRTLLQRDGGPDNLAQRAAYIWKTLPIPVIAALHGVAFGGGCQIALAADLRIAAPDTRMAVMEITYGLIPDMALTQTLPDLLPIDVAKELAFSGRMVAAEEALKLGLITRIAGDPRAAALELARAIATKSPHAVRASKALLDSAWRADARRGLALEEELQRTLLGSPNQMEAVNASLAKRLPTFADPTMED